MQSIKSTVGLCVVFISIVLVMFFFSKLRVPELSADEMRTQGVFILPTPRDIGPFELLDHRGTVFNRQSLEGHWSFIFFGFTNCPDVCPTELAIVADAIDLLPADVVAKVAPVFITIDPDRDTPELVKEYAANFHENMVGLTGTPEQIAVAGKAYRVYFAKRETESGSYTMDHTSYIYIMDKQGRYYRHFRMNSAPEEIAEALKAAVAG